MSGSKQNTISCGKLQTFTAIGPLADEATLAWTT